MSPFRRLWAVAVILESIAVIGSQRNASGLTATSLAAQPAPFGANVPPQCVAQTNSFQKTENRAIADSAVITSTLTVSGMQDMLFDLNVTTQNANNVVASPLVPKEPLAAFAGETPKGVWILPISDDANQDGGSLNSWSLAVDTGGCGLATPTAPPTLDRKNYLPLLSK
ncbi:MAG TPA: proprotein convertase P-domain-containing protein [Herpetosiphonaceae bacterium]